MTKEDILNIIKRCSTIDINENIKYVDVMDYDKLASMLEKAINFAHSSTLLEEKCKMSFGSWKQSVGLNYGFGQYIDKKNKPYTIEKVDKMYEEYYNL